MSKEEKRILLRMRKSVRSYIVLKRELERNDTDRGLIFALAQKLLTEYLDELPLFELFEILETAKSKVPYSEWDRLNRFCFQNWGMMEEDAEYYCSREAEY